MPSEAARASANRAAVVCQQMGYWPDGQWKCTATLFDINGSRSTCLKNVNATMMYCADHATFDFSGDVVSAASFATIPLSRWAQGAPLQNFNRATKCDAGSACPFWNQPAAPAIPFLRCVSCPARFHGPRPQLNADGSQLVVDGTPQVHTCVPATFKIAPAFPLLGACAACVALGRHYHFTHEWCFRQLLDEQAAPQLFTAMQQQLNQQHQLFQTMETRIAAMQAPAPAPAAPKPVASPWKPLNRASLVLNEVDKTAAKRLDLIAGATAYDDDQRAAIAGLGTSGTPPTKLIPHSADKAWASIEAQVDYFTSEIARPTVMAHEKERFESALVVAKACLVHGRALSSLYGFEVAWRYCVKLSEQHRKPSCTLMQYPDIWDAGVYGTVQADIVQEAAAKLAREVLSAQATPQKRSAPSGGASGGGDADAKRSKVVHFTTFKPRAGESDSDKTARIKREFAKEIKDGRDVCFKCGMLDQKAPTCPCGLD